MRLLLEPPFYLPELLAGSAIGGKALTSVDFSDDKVAAMLTEILRASISHSLETQEPLR